jgi:hypothetical protein
LFWSAAFFVFLFMLDMLGSPKSSPSSLSYPYSSSSSPSSSAFQSLFVVDKKSVYVLLGGEDSPEEPL